MNIPTPTARVSCLVLSCLVLSCLVLSCLVLSCLVFLSLHPAMTHQFLLCRVGSGLGPSIVRGISVNVGMMACYDQAREMLIDIFYPNEGYATQAVLPQFGAAMIAGFTASACSIPFDMIKTKLQNANEFKGITDAALHIVRKEGVLAFWTGFPAYYMRCVHPGRQTNRHGLDRPMLIVPCYPCNNNSNVYVVIHVILTPELLRMPLSCWSRPSRSPMRTSRCF
jgi:Mitochondrial carrier protein